ncbi:glycosyltransferase [Veronia nyctiphanis]|uniref:Glycosyltransferase n=1 Tax=Veronia nyctiphanis TaxID=1278244 RepID=A0A4Q0YVH4_9GAMM|nr:glycosyltransferase family 25 protein [Veronia nyctiphanis]RXJ72981.1 glycosyltransferase [Veronia nyctiphanis]
MPSNNLEPKSTSVFVISLMCSESRRQHVSNEFTKAGVSFEFFDAIDGRTSMPLLGVDYDNPKRLWLTSGKPPLPGECGCYASHYNLWLKCVYENRPIIICEDDIYLNERAEQVIANALDSVRTYGFLRLEAIEPGGRSFCVEEKGDFTYRLMEDNYGGLRAYAISPEAASRLIKHRWCFPVDCFVGANYIHGVDSFQMSPTLVVHHGDEETTFQNNTRQKTVWYRAPSRELYSLYKKVRLFLRYKRNSKAIKSRCYSQ